MSVIVAVAKGGKICLASDSQNNFGASQVPADNSFAVKIRRIGGAALGTTGWGLYENILDDYLATHDEPELADAPRIFAFFLHLWKELHERYPFVNDQAEKDDSPFGSLDASFLVGSPTGIFYVASDMSVTRFERYFAIGSGADFAMGALFHLYDAAGDAEAVARGAVETAIAFNVYCGGEVQIVEP